MVIIFIINAQTKLADFPIFPSINLYLLTYYLKLN